jgi:hypothetical protein
MTPSTDSAAVTEHLAAFAARLASPYRAKVITTGPGAARARHQPNRAALREDVICDTSTTPPGYLTS